MIPLPKLSDFTVSDVTFFGATRKVYRTGTSGPGIVLMHEIPGMTPEVLRSGKLLGDEGFRVALPSLFGTDGELGGLTARKSFRVCEIVHQAQREIVILAEHSAFTVFR
jgi:dienelactone hydrolase